MTAAAAHPAWSLLQEARRRAGLTQRQVAERGGTSQSAIARYERGTALPDLDTPSRLLLACGFDLRMRLEPHDRHDEQLLEERLAMTPVQRAELNRKIVAMTARAAAARRGGHVRPLAATDDRA